MAPLPLVKGPPWKAIWIVSRTATSPPFCTPQVGVVALGHDRPPVALGARRSGHRRQSARPMRGPSTRPSEEAQTT